MNVRRLIILGMIALGASATILADKPTIADKLNSEGSISIIQSEALNARLIPYAINQDTEIGNEHVTVPRIKAGYRVQVFDDNNVRTAKRDAQACKQQISTRFPDFPVYMTFSSPYWRVKVGDFRTRGEAESAMAEIKAAFPSMAKSLRIVRDRIQQR